MFFLIVWPSSSKPFKITEIKTEMTIEMKSLYHWGYDLQQERKTKQITVAINKMEMKTKCVCFSVQNTFYYIKTTVSW